NDRPMALEINATIPAMQGYSDIAAECFIRCAGDAGGLPPRAVNELIARNGSNARPLHQALMDAFSLERGRGQARVALLSRRNDAQLTELRYLAEGFVELGTESDVVFPDELSGDEEVEARGKPYELIYRPLFVRRLEELSAPHVLDLLTDLSGRRALVLNP